MIYMNRCVFMGCIGSKNELKTAKSGVSFLSASMAVQTGTKDKKVTNWIPIVLFGKTAEYFAKGCDKGDVVMVEASCSIRDYQGPNGKQKNISFCVDKLFVVRKKDASLPPQVMEEVETEGQEKDEVPF